REPEEEEKPDRRGKREEFRIDVCGRSIPAKKTPSGVRAVVGDKAIDPESVRAYLAKAFGDNLDAVRAAMTNLAAAFTPDTLAVKAFGLYEKCRPTVAGGQRGWGQKGQLDLELIRGMAS